jgi:hypothetical protein
MDKTAQLLSQVGIGLHGLDHWHEAHHKQEAAKALSLIFPGIETHVKRRSAKVQPPFREKKALFNILSGIAMGAYRFNRERGFNQRLDTIESNQILPDTPCRTPIKRCKDWTSTKIIYKSKYCNLIKTGKNSKHPYSNGWMT